MLTSDLSQALTPLLGPALGQTGISLEAETSCHRPMGEEGSDGVDPTSLWRFIRNAQHLAYGKPTITGRQRHGKTGFVEMAQIYLARLPLFSSAASWLC